MLALVRNVDARIFRSDYVPGYANFTYIKDDTVLQGTVIATFDNQTVKECEGKCYDEYWCKSINIEKSGLKTCELNMESEADKTFLLTLTKKNGWQFRSTDFTDPLIGEVCKRLKPCPPGYLCMDSSRCPRYKCYECRTINLGIHCNKPLHATALGIADKERIKNYQLSCSSEGSKSYNAYAARLNIPAYYWYAKQSTKMKNEYIRVDFKVRKIITGIALQSGTYSGWIKSYRLLYTTDSYQWMTYMENKTDVILSELSGDSATKTKTFSVYFRAFAVKINPITFVHYMCLRMELYGIDDPEQPAKPEGCTNHAKTLGMGSLAISDTQITASSYLGHNYRARKARLNSYGTWCNKRSDVTPHLQVNFRKSTIVTDIASQGRIYANGWVQTYNIAYKDVGSTQFNWVNNSTGTKTLFIGNVDKRGIVKNKFEPPIRAEVIRVYPVSYVGHICMRIELYGLLMYMTLVANSSGRIFRSDYVPGYANFTYIKDDAILQGTVISIFNNQTVKECEGKCYDEYWCKSINIEKSGLKTCELNMESEADKTFLLTLTKKSGWQFRSTDFTDPLIGEVCKRLKPCPPGYLCMDSSRCPRYKCYECRTINLGIHCQKPLYATTLGIADRNIVKRYQISSSSDPSRVTAYAARLNSENGWCAKQRTNMQNEYIRVDFITRKVITGIEMRNANCPGDSCVAWIESYRLLYTNDSYQWKTYKENGTDEISSELSGDPATKTKTFSVYFRAFAVKINPITFVRDICLRMELYGIEDPIQPENPPGCAKPAKPLGMGSSAISREQITASSTHTDRLPSMARLNHYSTWCSGVSDPNPYLQVDLLTLKIVTDIATQGRPSFGYKGGLASTYSMEYSSEDLNTFTSINNSNGTRKFFNGNDDVDQRGIVKNKLEPPIRARVIRVYPVSKSGYICMRMELFGCEPTSLVGFQGT
eukprot:gene105-715_t